MIRKLALIHTSATLVPIFGNLAQQYLQPKFVQVFNIVDDSLIQSTIRQNELTPLTTRRVVNYVASAEEAGADFIMVTCSSIGPAVDMAASLTAIPVLRVDQPMADQAVGMGKKIGVVATLATTLEPTEELVSRRAKEHGKAVEITIRLCEGAFEALMGGSPQEHDRMVADALKTLAKEVEVIVLAQASMARVVDRLSPTEKPVPILSSPEIAMQYLSEVL